MFDPRDLVRGFEIVWLIWAVSGISLCAVLVVAVRRMRWRHFVQILRDEDGATYTLSYVLLLPFLMLLIGAVVESSLMLMAKTGTVYASYAGARTAIVRYSAESPGEAGTHTEQAVRRAFVPFASGTRPVRGLPGVTRTFTRYYRAYSEGVDNPGSRKYVWTKYRYAHHPRNLRVEVNTGVDGKPPSWKDDVTVTVTYRYPFILPGIGRLLKQQEDNGQYYFLITSSSSLQNEAPQNEQQELGIEYASP